MTNQIRQVLILLVVHLTNANSIVSLEAQIFNNRIRMQFRLPAENYSNYLFRQFIPDNEWENVTMKSLRGDFNPWSPVGYFTEPIFGCGPYRISIINPSGVQEREIIFVKHDRKIRKLQVAVHGTPSNTLTINVTNHDSCLQNQYYAEIQSGNDVVGIKPRQWGSLLYFSEEIGPCFPCLITVNAKSALPEIEPSDPVEVSFGQISLEAQIVNNRIRVEYRLPVKNYSNYLLRQFRPDNELENLPLTALTAELKPWSSVGYWTATIFGCGPYRVSLINPSGVQEREIIFVKHDRKIRKLQVAFHGTPGNTLTINVTNHDSCLQNQYHAVIQSGKNMVKMKPSQSGSLLYFSKEDGPCYPCLITVIAKNALPEIEPSDAVEVSFGQRDLQT